MKLVLNRESDGPMPANAAMVPGYLSLRKNFDGLMRNVKHFQEMLDKKAKHAHYAGNCGIFVYLRMVFSDETIIYTIKQDNFEAVDEKSIKLL